MYLQYPDLNDITSFEGDWTIIVWFAAQKYLSKVFICKNGNLVSNGNVRVWKIQLFLAMIRCDLSLFTLIFMNRETTCVDFHEGTNIDQISIFSERITVDLAIMANHCDTIVLTALMSTFGLWGAYLSNSTVYYNLNIKDAEMKSATEIATFTSTQRILPFWIPIRLWHLLTFKSYVYWLLNDVNVYIERDWFIASIGKVKCWSQWEGA